MRAEEQLRGKRILIVDDHQMNIFALESALDALLDVSLSSVASGREALALLEQGESSFDIVLMDMMMPEMDGFEATRCIRAMNSPLAERLVVIAVTARAMLEDREKCFAAGVTNYISKPVDIVELIDVMARHIAAP